ncbi:MAG TPA: TraR/DksA C4-type zinc finger protein [Myxococcota bacterium]|nr:TraR/DksA C4-type zinc finger protein [Myxococcota bacterium]
MRNHFHRCGYLRVLDVDVRELSGARKGGRQVLEELCDAKRLAPCLGLVDCDILSPAQKRELLVARATRLRREEGGRSLLADAPDPRAAELEELRRELLEERNAIAQENQRRSAEAAGALRRNARPLSRTEEHELRAAGVTTIDDDALRTLRTARLDAIDRALDALSREGFGDCARCGEPIEIQRLREAPDTVVCQPCARAALPEVALGSSPAAPDVHIH